MLAEELALLAMHPNQRRRLFGRRLFGRRPFGNRTELNACLAGLLVAELVLDGSAELRARDTIVLTGREPGSSALIPVAGVVSDKGPKLKAILSHMDRGLQRRAGNGTWDFVAAALDPADGARRNPLVARLRDAAAGHDTLEPRTALVLACTGPANLLELVAPERRTRRHARGRIDHVLDGSPFEPVLRIVKKLIAENATAVVVASTGATAG